MLYRWNRLQSTQVPERIAQVTNSGIYIMENIKYFANFIREIPEMDSES
jgi:hypothetical protein